MAAKLIKTLLLSWMLTVLIESLSAFLAGLRGRRNYGLLFLVNTFTNPLAVLLVYVLYRYTPLLMFPAQIIVEAAVFLTVYVLYRYTPLLMFPAQIIVEAAVFLTEGLIFRQCVDSEKCGDSYRNPWILSLIVNLVSFATGLLLSLLI